MYPYWFSPAAQQAQLWVPVAACCLILPLRLSLKLGSQTAGIDDVFMFTAWIAQIVATSLIQATLDDSSPPSSLVIESVLKADNYSGFAFAVCLALGKTSVAISLLKIFPLIVSVRRWAIIVITLILLWGLFIVYSALELSPTCSPRGYAPHCVTEDLTNIMVFAWVGYQALLDILYAVIPASFIWNLQMSTQKKLALTFCLSLGWLAAVVALLRVLSSLGLLDFTVSVRFYSVTTGIEPALVIICGSLCSIVSLFRTWSVKRAWDSLRGTKRTAQSETEGRDLISTPRRRIRGDSQFLETTASRQEVEE